MLKRCLAAAALLLVVAVSAAAQTAATTVNGSVVITTGNTFQTVLAAITGFTQRRSLTIQNNNASDSCWVFVGGGTATKATSMLLLAGGSYSRYYPYLPSDAIQGTCATSSSTLYIETQ